MYDGPKVEQYFKEVMRQVCEHRIEDKSKQIEMYINKLVFDELAERAIYQLHNKFTHIRLQCEKNLTKSPKKYKHRDITKAQVRKIRLLKHLQRKYNNNEECEATIEIITCNTFTSTI